MSRKILEQIYCKGFPKREIEDFNNIIQKPEIMDLYYNLSKESFETTLESRNKLDKKAYWLTGVLIAISSYIFQYIINNEHSLIIIPMFALGIIYIIALLVLTIKSHKTSFYFAQGMCPKTLLSKDMIEVGCLSFSKFTLCEMFYAKAMANEYMNAKKRFGVNFALYTLISTPLIFLISIIMYFRLWNWWILW